MAGYQHRRHNKNLLMVHLIFVTKYRKKLLCGSLREDLKQAVFDTCRTNHWYIRRMETDRDHIHILLQYNPADKYSTWEMWKRHAPFLKTRYWKERTFWSDGYFAASVGEVSAVAIERYIEEQG